MSEMSRLKKELGDLEFELRKVVKIEASEPTEDGFYIINISGYGYGKSPVISTDKTLYLKALGTWFNLSDGHSMVGNWRKQGFEDFIGVDERTVELTITRLEDTGTYPSELLQEDDDKTPLERFEMASDDDGGDE
ncbi:MAG: hypothetical protein WCL21_18565, partial [Mariniphaga sp.]